MKSAVKTSVIIASTVSAMITSPLVRGEGQPAYEPAEGYTYPAQGYAQTYPQQPVYDDGRQYPQPGYDYGQQYAERGYGGTQQYVQPGYDYGQQYAEPGYGGTQQYVQPGYDYAQQYAEPAYGYAQQYSQPGYDYVQQYAEPAYDYGQPYAQPGYGYEQPYPQYDYGYGQPGYDYQQPYAGSGYAGDPYAYYGYPQQQDYAYSAVNPYPGYAGVPGSGRFPNVPWSNLNTPDIFGEKSPFQDPLQHEGSWTKEHFQPWRTGPFAYDKWEDHPATKMPWGNFPGWGKGFFGGFGPDTWDGVTPWGNDVPFKWVDPTDPEESFAQIWEDALNAPNRMGRMPPGFTAPYISVPNPIDVENEFERNAKNAPDEIHKMWGEGADFGGDSGEDSSGKDKESKDGKGSSDAPAGQDANGKNANSGNPPPKKEHFWKEDFWD